MIITGIVLSLILLVFFFRAKYYQAYPVWILTGVSVGKADLGTIHVPFVKGKSLKVSVNDHLERRGIVITSDIAIDSCKLRGVKL